MPTSSNEKDAIFSKLCILNSYLTVTQLKEARQAQISARENLGMELPLPEVLISKNMLTREEVDEINRVVRVQTGEARIVGGYEVLSKIGEGGMGVVYKAKSKSSGDVVALKVLPPALARNSKFLARFKHEAEIANSLHHENIVRYIEFGLDSERKLYYSALEFIEGENLDKIVKKEIIPEKEAIRIVNQMAEALQHAASRGLVHRDVKPLNIMVTPAGQAKLLDLGLARNVAGEETHLTQTGSFIGSPHYSSPEQIRGDEEVDIRCDIYSLGATFYYMVTGEAPFQAATTQGVLTRVLSEQIPWPAEINSELSDGACRIIQKMMARSPTNRYRNAEELMEDLQRVEAGQEPEGRVPAGKSAVKSHRKTLTYRTHRAERRTGKTSAHVKPVRGKLYIGAMSALLLMVLVGVIIFIPQLTTPPSTTTDTSRRQVDSPKSPDARREISETTPDKSETPAVSGDAQDKKDEEVKQKAKDMFRAAKEFAEKNPGEYNRIIIQFTRVRDENRDSPEGMMADAKVLEYEEKWKAEADEAFKQAVTKIEKHLATVDYTGAMGDLAAVPINLRTKVADKIKTEKARITAAGSKAINELLQGAEKKLSDGDYKGAAALLAEFEKIKFRSEKRRVAGRVDALKKKIDESRAAAGIARKEKMRKHAYALLDDFAERLQAGDYGAVRRWAEGKSSDKSLGEYAGLLAAAAKVAGALEDREQEVRDSLRGRVGEEIELETNTRVKKGTIKEITDEGIIITQKIMVAGMGQGEALYTVKWDELTEKQKGELATGWDPRQPDNVVAAALSAIAVDDIETAEKLARQVEKHPLSNWLAQQINAAKLGEREAEALEAWKEVEKWLEVKRLTTKSSKEALSAVGEFEKSYGDTKVAADKKSEIAGLKQRADRAMAKFVYMSAANIMVKLRGAAEKTVDKEVVSITVPKGKRNRAIVSVVPECRNARISYQFNGPEHEIVLRRSAIRGQVEININKSSIDVRTYLYEDWTSRQVLFQQSRDGLVPAGLHNIDVTCKDGTLDIVFDGKVLLSAVKIPVIGVGFAEIRIYDTADADFEIQNLVYANLDPQETQGTVEGLLVNKGKDFIEVIEDGETGWRRYELPAKSGGPATAAGIRQLILPNRVQLKWKKQGVGRKLVSIDVLEPQPPKGTLVGVVTGKAKSLIEVEPEDGKKVRLMPRWLGGMPNAGGGLDINVLREMVKSKPGDRVKIDWEYDVRPRVVNMEILP